MNIKQLRKNEGWLFQIKSKTIGFLFPNDHWKLQRVHGLVYRFMNIETGHSFPATAEFVHNVGEHCDRTRKGTLFLQSTLVVDGCNLSLVDV